MNHKKINMFFFPLFLFGSLITLMASSCDPTQLKADKSNLHLKEEASNTEKAVDSMQLSQAGYELLAKHLRGGDMQNPSDRDVILNRFPIAIQGVNENLVQVMEQQGDKPIQSEFDALVAVFHGLRNWGPTNWWKEASFVKALQDPHIDKIQKRKLAAALLFLDVTRPNNQGQEVFLVGLAKRRTVESNILVALVADIHVLASEHPMPTINYSQKSLTDQLGIDIEAIPKFKDNLIQANEHWKEFIQQNQKRIDQGKYSLLDEAANIYKAYWSTLVSSAGSQAWTPTTSIKEETTSNQLVQ